MDLGPVLRERYERTLRTNRIKLGAMLVLLVIVLLVMFELARWSRHALENEGATAQEQGEAEPPKPPIKTQEVVPPPKDEGIDVTTLTPTRPPVKLLLPKDEIERKHPYLTDPKTLTEVVDQNTDVESRPFLHLVYQVSQEAPEKARAEAEAKVPWPDLWDKASAHRAKAIRVSGELVLKWELDLPENPMGLTKLYAYRIREDNAPTTSMGHLYDVYAIDKLTGALRYDHLVAYSRFFKAMVSEGERLDDPDFHVAVAIARSIEPPTYLAEPRLPGPIVDGNRPEARPLYWLLQRARDIPFQDLKAKAKRDLTYLDFVNRPEVHRGQPVAVSGELRRLIRIALPENLLGMTSVFYGQIVDIDRKMNTFYCLDVPEGIHDRDPVILYGYFLKKWTYTSEGSYEVTSPVLVAKSMLIVDYGDAGSGRMLQWGLGIIVAVTAVALGIALVLSRSRDRKAEEARRQRDAARIRAELHLADPPKAAAPPAKSPDAQGDKEANPPSS